MKNLLCLARRSQRLLYRHQLTRYYSSSSAINSASVSTDPATPSPPPPHLIRYDQAAEIVKSNLKNLEHPDPMFLNPIFASQKHIFSALDSRVATFDKGLRVSTKSIQVTRSSSIASSTSQPKLFPRFSQKNIYAAPASVQLVATAKTSTVGVNPGSRFESLLTNGTERRPVIVDIGGHLHLNAYTSKYQSRVFCSHTDKSLPTKTEEKQLKDPENQQKDPSEENQQKDPSEENQQKDPSSTEEKDLAIAFRRVMQEWILKLLLKFPFIGKFATVISRIYSLCFKILGFGVIPRRTFNNEEGAQKVAEFLAETLIAWLTSLVAWLWGKFKMLQVWTPLVVFVAGGTLIPPQLEPLYIRFRRAFQLRLTESEKLSKDMEAKYDSLSKDMGEMGKTIDKKFDQIESEGFYSWVR